MSHRDLPLIFVGDLWKAVRALQPADDETLLRIVGMFDLFGDLRESPREPAARTVSAPAPEDAVAEADAGPLVEEDDGDRLGFADDEEPGTDDRIDVRPGEELTDSDPRSPGRRILPIRIEKLNRPPSSLDFGFAPRTVAPPTDEEHEPWPELLPLLDPNWMRAVVTALMSVRSHEGSIDDEALIERIARAELPAVLPQRSVWSMRRGVQLLVDSGSGLLPFARDVDFLCNAILRLAGPESVLLQRFRGGPWREVYDVARRERVAYVPPPAGVPVLLVTDFGLAREPFADDTAPASEWAAFLDGLRGAGVSVVALVPYPRHRWPQSIASRAALLPWDRGTTVLQARMARRRSER